MQGTDRMDQYRARYSVTDGHTYKKWYKKLAFGLIDLARVNAFLTWKIANKEKVKVLRDPMRVFMVALTHQLISGEWKDHATDDVMVFGATANESTSTSVYSS